MSNGIASKRRRSIIARMLPLQNYLCWWCAVDLNPWANVPHLQPSIEHLIGTTGHGSKRRNQIQNLVVACRTCNAERGTQEWRPHPLILGTERYAIGRDRPRLLRAMNTTANMKLAELTLMETTQCQV